MYKAKITSNEDSHKEQLEAKLRSLKEEMMQELAKRKRQEEDLINHHKEELAQYEQDFVPIARHEAIVNKELEKLETAYQERIASLHSESMKQVESRTHDEIEHLRKEKIKIEMYAKELESLNDQLRAQLSKKSTNLMQSAKLSPHSFV
jgi:hypothetical protein